MMKFIGSSTDVARFVADTLISLGLDSQLITITIQGRSEGCYVFVATDMWSEDIVKEKAITFSLQPITI